MAKADYYETLGVSKTASEAELKTAYRRLAMKYHPDRNPGDKQAEQKFKEINEAYEVLKDGDKKAAYDRYGHAAFDGGGAGRPGGGGFGDFHARFPDGASIAPGEFQTIAMHGANFITTYGINPTYELFETSAGIPNMREAVS